MVSCFKLFFSLTKSTHTCLSSSLSFSQAFSSSAWALVDHNEALSNFKLCTSQLGTFVIVVEGDCERGMDPLGITTSSPIKWKRISLVDSLTTSVDKGAVAIEGAWMDFEIEPLLTLIFIFLVKEITISKVSDNFFCYISHKFGNHMFFFLLQWL